MYAFFMLVSVVRFYRAEKLLKLVTGMRVLSPKAYFPKQRSIYDFDDLLEYVVTS